MKVNNFGMLIKFATLYFFINFIVVSAIPLNETKSDNEKFVEANEDYDATSHEKPTEASSDTKPPPLVFPSEESKNDTALEILQKNSNASIVNEKKSTEKEVNKDVANDNDKDYDEKESDKNKATENTQKDKPTSPKTDEVTEKEPDTKDKDYEEGTNDTSSDSKDVENIQENNQDQGTLEERYGVNSTTINVFEEPTLKGRHIAFIFATSLVFFSATAYVGLIIWRKTLERRYGMRQRLVTEDDYYNNNDVRFFGL